MAQERMEATPNTPRMGDIGHRPDIETVLSRASSATNKIRVVHGANEQYFDTLEGKTVGTVKKSLREVFNIPGDAEALIGGKQVGDDFILEPGMSLEFVKEAGVKGSLTFKQQVVLALLQDLKWMPSFSDLQMGAEYVGEATPTTESDMVKLSQRMLAVLVAETADQIVRVVCD